MELLGTIVYINPIEVKGEGDKAFTFRKMALDTSAEFNGMTFKGAAEVQVAGKSDCDIVEAYNIGDKVKVTCGVRGNLMKKEGLASTPKNPEGMVCYTSLNMSKIELISKAGNSVASTPTSAGTPAPENSDDLPF